MRVASSSCILIDGAGVTDGELDQREVVRALDAKATRGAHHLGTRRVLGDNLEEVVLRHAERFHERVLDATRDRFAMRRTSGLWRDADQWHGGIPGVPSVAG